MSWVFPGRPEVFKRVFALHQHIDQELFPTFDLPINANSFFVGFGHSSMIEEDFEIGTSNLHGSQYWRKVRAFFVTIAAEVMNDVIHILFSSFHFFPPL